ncbi:hypothetical protein M3Y99_00470400 [Aphelenchoides fujianensis]|nr:hypothetical protein M3Y99_00470400 [Aphelenchoides fujianensis]
MCCFSKKSEARYKRWWTCWFHAHCVACLFCLFGLFVFGRLVFDDLDKRQWAHLGVHVVAVGCLLSLLVGNRCKLLKAYIPYFVGYHACLVANIGLEIFDFYRTPHPTHEHVVSPMPPQNSTRFPNGQPSPFEGMYEETLWALILLVLIVQSYVTFVVVMSFLWVRERQNKQKVQPAVAVEEAKAAAATRSDGGQPAETTAAAPDRAESKWEKRFHTVGVVVNFVTQILPKNK